MDNINNMDNFDHDQPQNKSQKRAAALRYDPAVDDVPILTAYGQGHLAEKIIDKAIEADIPIVQDNSLADMLAAMNLGEEIPPALYAAVAQILVFISESDRQYGQKIHEKVAFRT